ncbi:MAG TPA: Asp-tRNA(Asn)/Glu-tRNA(Gln) amidotransferase subunit GatC [Candidatus Sulfotelmatobacter sp.]|nr:Asp-tRNA(Asn)/Glu-tRNA(Gln) amidotransferase subunit GatC [Candidatus Sulfotelmatobacter sp.]
MEIDVEHVARLARLGLSAAEKELFAKQLSAILEYAANLQKLDTSRTPPTAHAIPLKNVLREDIVVPCENTAEIMANAPAVEANMFLVPKIME